MGEASSLLAPSGRAPRLGPARRAVGLWGAESRARESVCGVSRRRRCSDSGLRAAALRRSRSRLAGVGVLGVEAGLSFEGTPRVPL